MIDFPPGTPAAHPDGQPPSLVVGVGASAGGVQALQQFFANVSPNSGLAYVVVLHLSPDHESRLAEILQVNAPMPVAQVTERVRINRDHVYVVSPSKSLWVVDNHLDVADMTRVEQRRAPVDLFFRALADAHGSRSAGVVLSGTGPDGSSGLKRIKEYGGLTVAQDPDEAQHGDMPRNAIATGLVDFVLPVTEIPGRIAAYAARLRRDFETDDGADASIEIPEREELGDVLRMLRLRTGHDFANYKTATLQRRILRRVHVREVPDLPSYVRTLREQPDEAVALMKELLISVTNFFRDPAAFETLAARVVPRLFENRRGPDQVRVWVPACATGEEAYSIAILLAEYAAAAVDQVGIQVFATDLDQEAIAAAREGFYKDVEVADVSRERLQRFFQKEPGGYRVRRDVREMVLFAHHNVIKDPPFSHLDLISCRNLLIYLNRAAQDRMLETFHFALRPGRYLFLGTSESADSSGDLFLTIDKAAHIYESRRVTTRLALPVAAGPVAIPRPAVSRTPEHPPERIAPAELHQRLLEEYAPPSLVATDARRVVHMSERVGRYLQVSGGEPTGDLLQLIRPELKSDLRVALHEATRQRAPVRVPRVRCPIDGVNQEVSITVKPVLRDADSARGFFLIVFDESDSQVEDGPIVQLPVEGGSSVPGLEEEISHLKSQLRTTIEQYETQAEEAKASNEELQAMNEELRSSAEELETSKEELQSVNEELITVNEELKAKVDQLAITNNDFRNLINSSDVGTIFLDRKLRVKLSTPAARAVFNLLETDSGRPLSDITSQVLYQGLYGDVHRVLEDLRTVDREVETRDGRWHMLRVRPYRTIDDRIDGVVITFQDITEQRNAERQVRQSEERLRLLMDSAVDYAIFTMGPDGRVDAWNTGAERMFGYRPHEIIGKPLDVLFTSEDRAAGAPAAELERAAREGRAPDERYHIRKNGERFYCSGVTTRLDPGAGLGFAKIARDLTDQRKAAEALKHAHASLDQAVQERTRELQIEILERSAAQSQATELLRKVVTSQEEERARIARDLHDQIGQQLTALRLTLERSAEERQADAQLARAIALAQAIDAELGFIAWELRPAVLDDLGLAAALPRFVQDWAEHYGIEAEYRAAGFEAGHLPREAEVAFYRIAQEALNNVSKHAHASRVDVMLESRDGSVMLLVEDDGVGFDVSAARLGERGIGLLGMQERAALVDATLQIESVPGDGTSVFLRRPVDGQRTSTGRP